MPKSKKDLKRLIKKWVKEKNKPFRSVDVYLYGDEVAKNLSISIVRITNYIRATKLVTYNIKLKKWVKNNGNKEK